MPQVVNYNFLHTCRRKLRNKVIVCEFPYHLYDSLSDSHQNGKYLYIVIFVENDIIIIEAIYVS